MSGPRRAAEPWGERSTVRAAGAAARDCPPPPGGTGGGPGGGPDGTGGGHGGGGPGGGGHGGGGHGGGGPGGGGAGGGGSQGCCCCAVHGHLAHHGHSGHHEHGHGHHAHHCGGHASDCGCHDARHDDCGCRSHDQGADGDSGRPPARSPGGTSIGWRNPLRPRRYYGSVTGQVPGGRLDPCDFDTPGWNQWPGDRGDLYFPFLFLRANAGDLGARPVVGPFWESPDILLLAGVEPSLAPRVPPELGQTALAGKPNTLYAHVWNFGISMAPLVVVEFYWCDPTLGIGPLSAHLIGATQVSLGARGSGRSHALVKCPTPWFPTFLNGGHECLVVRVWDETSDGLGTPEWDAALNRHVGQRNIHVVAAGDAGNRARSAVAAGRAADPPLLTPLTLNVGPLYGAPAQVAVARAAPHDMPWLQLRTGTRGQFPAAATPTGDVLLRAPTAIGGGGATGGVGAQHDVTGDDQQVVLDAGDAPPAPGEAHVYRVTASQQGQVFGGYTVVVMG